MSNGKNYTKAQIDRAYRKGNNTIVGGANVLGCSKTTFRRYYKKHFGGKIETIGTKPQPSGLFKDHNVESIVNEHRNERKNITNTLKNVICEIVDKIDADKNEINVLQKRVERHEKALKEMKL